MAMEHYLAIESFSYSWLINLKPNSFSFDCCPSRSSDDDDEEEKDSFGPPYPFDQDENDRLYCYDDQDDECFIEMDPKKWRGDLKNASSTETQDFNFHNHVSADTLVDADQIFAGGLLVPLHHLIAAAATTCSTASARMKKGGAVSSLEYHCCSPPFSEPTPGYEPLSPSNSAISSSSSSSSSTMSLLSSSTSHSPPPPAFLARCRSYSRRIMLRCVGFLRPFCWSCLQMRRRSMRRNTRPGILNVVSRPQVTTASPPRMSTSSSSSSSATQWGERQIMLGMASDVEQSISEAVLHCKRSNGESGS